MLKDRVTKIEVKMEVKCEEFGIDLISFATPMKVSEMAQD